MNIAVCVKDVPSAATRRRLDPATKRLDRSGDSELNPFDVHALEEALRIREAGVDVGEIVVVCMGPESAQRAVTKALALGADRAVLVSDDALAGSDIAGTAHVLATVVAKQNADLVILGQQAADADCYVMAAAVADHLQRPLVTQVAELKVDGGTLHAKRQAEHGYDVIEAPLPAVISVSDAINTPRLPSIKAIMGAKKKPLERLSAADAGVDGSRVGESGARTQVRSVSQPPPKQAGLTIEDAGGDSADKVVAVLAEKGLI
ncbi:MAG TPA: electron transfer flavoprotein subunit beta/FixA family protein [Thermoleophilia bacterium]|nr:electron transfer flavoprotein subunit beta/FixA family protein [Thermoleophilia bacterium]